MLFAGDFSPEGMDLLAWLALYLVQNTDQNLQLVSEFRLIAADHVPCGELKYSLNNTSSQNKTKKKRNKLFRNAELHRFSFFLHERSRWYINYLVLDFFFFF